MGGGPRRWRDVASQPPAQVVARAASMVTTVGRTPLLGRAYVATVAVLLIVYAAIPSVHAELAVALCLLAVGAIWYGVVHRRPRRWGGWLVLAAGDILLSAGLVGTAVDPPTADLSNYPTAGDVAYLLAYLPLAVGLLWLGRPRVASRDLPMMLDTLALGLAGSMVVWIALIRPAVMGLHLGSAGQFTAVASGVGWVAILAAGARVMLSWRVNLALALLCFGVIAFLFSDFEYAIALVHGSLGNGLFGLGFATFIGLTGAAALTPSMTRVDSPIGARHHLGAGRLAMLAVALLIAPSVLLLEATTGGVTTGVAIGVVALAVGVVVLIRLALSSRVLRLRATRDRALAAASRNLMLAANQSDVAASLDHGFTEMLGPDGPGAVRLSDPEPAGDAGPDPDPPEWHQWPGPPSTLNILDGRAELTVRVTHCVVTYTGPIDDVVELIGMLESMADQAGLALTRIELESRLRTDDRERYFRSLVLTSREVTLICRKGRVEYATPSARAMFGYDVQGRQFDTVVRRGAVSRGMPIRTAEGWSPFEEGVEGYIDRPDGAVLTVEVHRRDLTDDPTVRGIVTTLRDVTAERELRQELSHRASHDGLTGLANAELFREELRAERELNRGNVEAAVLFLDLDDFKAVNDTHGHEVGDGLLITVAHRIRSTLRVGDLAARLGGDEFAVLLRDVPNADAARAAAQRIEDALIPPAVVAGISLDCKASIGLAIATRPSEYDSLMRHADTALYSAKADGKGRWQQYRSGMMSAVRRRADLREELETAIREEALTLHYQPVVELATGVTVGFEALLRAREPGSPSADRAIPASASHLVRLAEDHGLIVQLGHWVLGQALRDARVFNEDGAQRPVFVGVNVSAAQLRQPGFVDDARELLTGVSIDPGLLVLEITESLLARDDERPWGYLADLRTDGVRVAIDDYGTGYASLSYLRHSGIDIVKIDRSFVQDGTSPRARLLLESVVTLTTRLGLAQVAEGIENESTRELLVQLGCRYGQGFLFAEAMPLPEAMEWARSHSPHPVMR
jgi:diguanylate cyclase (GGDEF)-like protein/PAS domain S-box-containing protein